MRSLVPLTSLNRRKTFPDFLLSTDRSTQARMTLTDPRSNAMLPVEVVAGKIMNERGEPIANARGERLGRASAA